MNLATENAVRTLVANGQDILAADETPGTGTMCLAREWRWNTFVMVAKASTLVSVADVLLPGLHRRLTAAAPFLGTRREGWALGQAYASLPRHNFSETVLQAGLPFLAVRALPPRTVRSRTPPRLFKLSRPSGHSAWIGAPTAAAGDPSSR